MTLGFNRLRVATRIYVGFALLILIAMGVAGFAVERLSAVGSGVAGMNNATGNTTLVLETAARLEGVRRAMLRYRLFQEPDALKAVRDNLAETSELMRKAAAATVSQEQLRIYNSIADDVRAFGDLTDKVARSLADIDSSRKALVTGGDELTAATGRLTQHADASFDPAVTAAAAAAERSVLLIRIANWRFQATRDAGGIATFKAGQQAAEADLARLDAMLDPDARAFVPPVRSALAAYAAGFEHLAAAVNATERLYETDIVQLITGMQERLQSAKASLAAYFAATKQASDETISGATRAQAGLTAAALVLGVLLAATIGRGIARPLAGMTETMKRLAGGDTSVDVAGRDSTDEIGEMARAVDVFRRNMISNAEMAATRATEQAAKEARQKAVDGHVAAFDRSVRDLLDTLASAATEMRASAESMAATADQTNQQAGSVSAAAGQASANVQTMAAATEEMASSAAEIARQVARSTAIAAKAVDAARKTDRQVQGLADTAQKIEAVVAIINGIASQTNLLALNATIEAARAGDAGKGFAVVASEVKALAGQTGKATEEIGAQIQAIQSATRSAVDAIKDIGATIDEMNDISTAIAAAIEEQGATTTEMTRNTQQAAQGTQEVSVTINNVSQGASATGTAANQVLSAASALGGKTETLRAEVSGFLNRIKAA